MTEDKNFIQKKAVKEHIKQLGLNCGSDIFETLNEVISKEIDKAGIRCVANGRKTVSGRDL